MNVGGEQPFFVDTNVLLYSVDPADPRKQDAAVLWLRSLWNNAAGCLSWQVLHEFYANAVKKLRTPHAKARFTVETFAEWRTVDTTIGVVRRAWYWSDEALLPYWDGLIVAAAERAECRWLLSEDFQEGRTFESVTVINPFRADPAAFGLTGAVRPS